MSEFDNDELAAIRAGDVTDLQDADLRSADLQDANLWGANLQDANIEEATLPAYEITPQEGAFVAWKATRAHTLKLRVPAEAARLSTPTGRKCRAERVEVVEILDADGEACDAEKAYGWHDEAFVYREGEIAEPDDWDNDIRVECSHGLHFFMTKEEAVEWM